jgi:hypothetical protein
MPEEEKSLFRTILRGIMIVILGVFVFAGLVLGACFVMAVGGSLI